MAAADRELTGHRWHPSVDPDDYEYVGRRHVLFAVEEDAHRGSTDVWRLPAFPVGHPMRSTNVRRVQLPGPGDQATSVGVARSAAG